MLMQHCNECSILDRVKLWYPTALEEHCNIKEYDKVRNSHLVERVAMQKTVVQDLVNNNDAIDEQNEILMPLETTLAKLLLQQRNIYDSSNKLQDLQCKRELCVQSLRSLIEFSIPEMEYAIKQLKVRYYYFCSFDFII